MKTFHPDQSFISGALVALLIAGATPGRLCADAAKTPADSVPPLVRSYVGDRSTGVEGRLSITNIGKRQQHDWNDRQTLDKDIFSPKSATFSTDGRRLYVNSLEGCKTAVYTVPELEKVAVVSYTFSTRDSALWAEPSGFYPATHYPATPERQLCFSGKPVELAWSHGGRYLWVPFYRRSFDINAQDPSAIAVVDTRTHSVVRLFETGPLPKGVAVAPDNSLVAITHWGDNTLGFIDISSGDMNEWHHLPPITVGHKLELDFPLDRTVNRDANSGFLLRGMAFTPDGRYLLVSALAGPLAVVDLGAHALAGMAHEAYGIRHLAISSGTVWGTRNIARQVVRFALDSLYAGIERACSRSIPVGGGVKTLRVAGGPRTIDCSPDGRYLFVACNSGSAVNVVDAASFQVVDSIACDSYPVGLALSPDGRYMAVTSQGRNRQGGNALNLFEVARPDLPGGFFGLEEPEAPAVEAAVEEIEELTEASPPAAGFTLSPWLLLFVSPLSLLAVFIVCLI